MVQVIKPQQVKVVTNQGECVVSIVLDLNINLTSDGRTRVQEDPLPAPREEQVEWAVPEFGPAKIKFGKTEGA
jgi:hypothetical protein